MKKLFTVLGIAAAVLLIYHFADSYVNDSLRAVNENDDTEINVEISSGSTTKDVAKILFDNDLIKNKRAFKYYAGKTGRDSMLKAGSYTLKKSMNTDELLMVLTGGEGISDNTANVTIIEGMTMEDVANLISGQLGLSYDKLLKIMNNGQKFKGDFEFLNDNPEINILQGYLMPDTYNVYKDSSEEDIVKILLKQFDSFYTEEVKPRMEKTKLSFPEVINLASIIEKEAKLDEEKNEVAAVFLNRLNIGMKLQSCATVNYARGEWKERLTYEDIAIDSPYNTYLVEGLPPEPINSPGRASIIAAMEPADVDYLFFVSKGDGSHYFSKSYDEHIEAADEYLID